MLPQDTPFPDGSVQLLWSGSQTQDFRRSAPHAAGWRPASLGVCLLPVEENWRRRTTAGPHSLGTAWRLVPVGARLVLRSQASQNCSRRRGRGPGPLRRGIEKWNRLCFVVIPTPKGMNIVSANLTEIVGSIFRCSRPKLPQTQPNVLIPVGQSALLCPLL